MNTALAIINFVVTNYGAIFAACLVFLGALTSLLSAALIVALIIPGDQPDKILQKAVDILTKLSKK